MADPLDELRYAPREDVLDAIEDAFHTTDELDDHEIRVIYEPRDDEQGCDIRLLGKVATETERQIAAQIITDRLGIPNVENRLIVDEGLREDAPYYDKPVHDDTDELGQALELVEGGTANDEFGYIPPDHPIAEENQEATEPHGREGRR